jgi:hypothetical protein
MKTDVPDDLLTEDDLIRVFQDSPQLTSQQVIEKLKIRLKRAKNRDILRDLIKKVALKSSDGMLRLKPEFRSKK